MQIRQAEQSDLGEWAKLREALWSECTAEALLDEARSILASADQVCFLLMDPSAGPVGFVEAAVHAGAEGPYGHVEGWYVLPEFRNRGHGRELIGRVEQWCLHRAIHRLTSDTTPAYPASPAAHAGSGFRKLQEFTIFIKEIGGRK